MPAPALPWRPEFLDALRMLARASEALAVRGLPRPVLVGGSAVMTGDIDVTSPVQPELEEELQKLGFVRPNSGDTILIIQLDPRAGARIALTLQIPGTQQIPGTHYQIVAST